MTALTTDLLPSELLRDDLVTLEQVSTGITVLAINASVTPEQSPRVRQFLGDLLLHLQNCETELGLMPPLVRTDGSERRRGSWSGGCYAPLASERILWRDGGSESCPCW